MRAALRHLSVCSGIGAPELGWAGISEAVAVAEIDKFPSAVLALRFPGVPNLGDMTKFKEWQIGPVDILVGGTPCQSFSVAGLRAGLADPRGNLAHTLRGTGFDASEDGTGRGTPLVATSVALRGRDGGGTIEVGDDLAFALRASTGGGDKPHVLTAAPIQEVGKRTGISTTDPRQGISIGSETDPMFTLQAGAQHGVITRAAVRRLTPTECGWMPGFPDGFTAIPWRGKPADQCPDGPRYKALGNSMAVPVLRWIGQRLAAVDQILEAADAA